jgi:hypothetical protein
VDGHGRSDGVVYYRCLFDPEGDFRGNKIVKTHFRMTLRLGNFPAGSIWQILGGEADGSYVIIEADGDQEVANLYSGPASRAHFAALLQAARPLNRNVYR